MRATKLHLVDSLIRTRQPRRSLDNPGLRHQERPSLREQVAAVCYRLRGARIQFLLVQTRKKRWTFPKGCIEPGLTYAQSAALEAFEEAGVHGRLEDVSFAHYTRQKRGKDSQTNGAEIAIHCYLCEVLSLEPPQEINRNPTWFYPEKAKLCLKADRKSGNGEEISRIIDRAVSRIERLRKKVGFNGDALHRVDFEASEIKTRRMVASAAFADYIRGKKENFDYPAALRLALNSDKRRLLRLGPAPPSSSANQKS